jgi:hypothetical protein
MTKYPLPAGVAIQLASFRRTLEDVNTSGLWPGKVVTEVEPASAFWEGPTGAPELSGTNSKRIDLPLHQAKLDTSTKSGSLGIVRHSSKKSTSQARSSALPDTSLSI